MFKKFKDKLAEEMKQSPARLQASVQQLAQAVVSPALSNSSVQEMSASNDNFSLTEEGDETPKSTPIKHSFQNVNLMSPSLNMGISRRSSVSSITSDASSLFPIYESPPNLYHLQSDMDQSASEIDDNITPHLDKVTKDQLYSAYRKVQAKYHKYRGRYTDLATHYRELDKIRSKLESLLVETQDKALRRITDLKEQCQLEQQAKAHLEEALRNDIEEKDHIINTLNTKIKLLQSAGSTLESSISENVEQKENSKDNLIDLTTESVSNENSVLFVENTQLRNKLKKLEGLVLKYKESLKRNKDKCTEVMKEKNILENDHEKLKNSTTERISIMESELNAARAKIENFTKQVDTLHKREEESAISLAENKLSVHRELEEKEEQIKQLRIDLKHTADEKKDLNEALTRYEAELSKLKLLHANSNLTMDKNAIVYSASKEKHEPMKGVQHAETTKHNEESDRNKTGQEESGKYENALEETTLRLKKKEVEFQELRCKLDELEKQSAEDKHNRETLQTKLSNCKTKYMELRNEYDVQKIVMEEKQKNTETTIEKLQATVQSVDKELENMRNALIDRDQVCENYNKKVLQYSTMLEKAKHKLSEQEIQIKSLKNRLEELSKVQEELEIKRTELNAVQSELEFCRSTNNDLRNKAQADGSAINLLKKERSDLINRLVYYKDYAQRLKQDCTDIKDIVNKEFSNRQTEMSNLNATITVSFIRLVEENVALNSQVNQLRSKIRDSEQSTFKEIELQSELRKVFDLKSTFETELKEHKKQLKEMTLKSNRYDELNIKNNKLIAEIDNLHFKIHDLEKIVHQLTESHQEIKNLREASSVSEKVDELNMKLYEAICVINSLKSRSSRALREELFALRTEISRLKDIPKKEETKTYDDENVVKTKQSVGRYLYLENRQIREEKLVKQTAKLVEKNKILQKTIGVKCAQLKKIKVVKERQGITIEEMSAKLNEWKTKRAELSNMLETSEKQIESLKSENSQLIHITLENKNLKSKHNNLWNHNRKLCENEEAMKQKIESYEKNIRDLDTIVESYKHQINSRSEEVEHLNSRLIAITAQLECKNAESSSLNDRLTASEKELQEVKKELNKQNMEFQNKVCELNAAVTSSNLVIKENELLLTELKSLREEIIRFKNIEDKNTELKSQFNDLMKTSSDIDAIRSENSKLIAERIDLRNQMIEFESLKHHNIELQARVNNLQSKIFNLEALKIENDRLHSEVEALQSTETSSTELSTLRDFLAEKETEIKLLEDKNFNMSQEIGCLRGCSLEVDEKAKEVDTLRISLVLLEKKVTNLQTELNSLIQANDSLQKELETARNKESVEYQFDAIKLREENKRLEAQLDEALITFQAKETQMQLMDNELKEQANQFKEQLRTNEEEQGMRLKQLVKEFQAQLHDKEEELQAALEKRFDRQHNYESDLVQQYKEQLKDFQLELTEKSEQIESLVLEKKDALTEKGKDIDRLVETIAQIKKEHANEIKEVEKKWKVIVQQRIDNLQAKHEEELNELTKEWQNERKPDVQTDAATEELENTSRVAMAAIQTNTGSIHTLQQTLTSQRKEIAELRKLVKLRHDMLEDSTEIEYLRNILFEYMMGKETLVLARVIAAVVKFDQEQTAKILKKEEDKLTLFGSLGLA